ncbi:MAG TPA: phage tail protein [Actinomycetota bacterium]|nr:phage tail protein [Actinomycetota bacterium]
MTTPDAAVGLYFNVQIEGVDLGAFTSCDGLSMDIETEDRIEGGNNAFVWKLPVRIKYANVKFTRPVGQDSMKVASWLAKLATGVKRTTAEIVALTPEGNPLVSWKLLGVIPVKWQGPSFSAESPKVAQETLEIAHNGFTFEVA